MSRSGVICKILNEVIKCQSAGGLGFILVNKLTKKEINIYSEDNLLSFINTDEDVVNVGEYSYEADLARIVYWDYNEQTTMPICVYSKADKLWAVLMEKE